jgi:hypothetical protein
LILIQPRRASAEPPRHTRTIGPVTSDDLTPAQLAKLAEQIGRQRDYLTRLRERMQALGFPPSDPLCSAAAHAWEAMSNLTVVAATKANRKRKSK